MKILIKNALIVTADEVLSGNNLLVADGKIEYIGKDIPYADKVIDAEGDYLLPGFIDLHCHGGDGYEFMDASPEEMNHITDFHLAHGTTTMLATTLAAPDSEIDSCLSNIARFLDTDAHQTVLGVHLEGPWFDPEQSGAQNPEHIRPPRDGEITELFQKYPFIKRISAAPEICGGLELGDEASSLGIIASVGHSGADFGTVEQAISHGYTLMTHLYSGMLGVVRRNSYRIAGAVEAGLYFDDLFVEIIADGKHLPAELLRYIYKIKGCDRICLITDAIRAAGMSDGSMTRIGSKDSGLDVIVEDGVAKLPSRQSFAGSTATADRLYSTILDTVGCNIVSASRMASLTPARLLGLSDRGEIAVGKRADLILTSIDGSKLNIKQIIFGGKEI